ncbi:MAG: DNA methyltransferase, partial [Candidatus Bathyarchaeia archaeon]
MKNKRRLNYLDGKTWAKYSISIWSIVKSPEEVSLGHPAMFPVELCKRLIEIYTWPGEVVLDPFMGSGSVIVAAKELMRKGIGFDIVPEFVELTKKRLSEVKPKLRRSTRLTEYIMAEDVMPEEREELEKRIEGISEHDVEPEVYCEDARNLLSYIKPETIDLCITSPPYWIVHKRERTADYKEPRPYSTLEADLGNIEDYGKFMTELSKVFQVVHEVLKSGKRCI